MQKIIKKIIIAILIGHVNFCGLYAYDHDFAEAQGIRPTMEDAHVELDGTFFGIFDGHGGDAIAKSVITHLPASIVLQF